MATNPQSLTSSDRSRSFAAGDCWKQAIHLGRKFSETVIADRSKAGSFVLGEKKHE